MPQVFAGHRDPQRRAAAEQDAHAGLPTPIALNGSLAARDDLRFAEFRKTATTFAVRMDEDFEVDTLEGIHTGRAGDYLAIGSAGEMYPIAADVFEATYEPLVVHPDSGA